MNIFYTLKNKIKCSFVVDIEVLGLGVDRVGVIMHGSSDNITTLSFRSDDLILSGQSGNNKSVVIINEILEVAGDKSVALSYDTVLLKRASDLFAGEIRVGFVDKPEALVVRPTGDLDNYMVIMPIKR